MNLKYLFSKLAEMSQLEQAPEGEPVIPCFPCYLPSFPCYLPSFIGVPSFKPCVLSTVKEIPSIGGYFDILADKIAKYYTGIPKDIIEQYVIATARAASQFPEGTILRVFMQDGAVSVQDVKTEDVIYLWKTQPKTKEN